MSQPNPIKMQKYLSGINYPASRDELVEHAKSAGADQEVLEHLHNLPDKRFDGPDKVSQSYAKET